MAKLTDAEALRILGGGEHPWDSDMVPNETDEFPWDENKNTGHPWDDLS